MHRAILVLALIALVAVSVDAHSKLNSPTAWNPRPATGNVCGGGAPATTAAATWQAGSTAQMVWEVVAGDGAGPVTIKVDPAGGTTFSQTLTFTGPTPPSVGTYTFTVNIPSTLATSGLCTIQIRSSSNWVACTSVAVQSAAPPPPPTPAITCATATGLSFCTGVNGKSVAMPETGAPLSSLDVIAQETLQLNQMNPAVFDSGASAACGVAYKDFLCALLFPLCPTSSVNNRACASRCVNVLNACGVNVTHQFLYDCGQMVTSGSDSMGTCPANVPTVVLVNPLFSPLAGGVTVTISGFNLGSGSDVQSVTLAGVPVQSIQSQSATQVVVVTAATTTSARGSIVVRSASAGQSISTSRFEYAGAPTVLSAVLSGRQITLSFDIATNLGGQSGNFSCGTLLQPTTVSLLGNGSSCYWYDYQTLMISLGVGATVDTTSTLALNTGVIANSYNIGGTASGAAVVTVPAGASYGWVAAPVLILLAAAVGAFFLYRKFCGGSGGGTGGGASKAEGSKTASPAGTSSRTASRAQLTADLTDVTVDVSDSPRQSPAVPLERVKSLPPSSPPPRVMSVNPLAPIPQRAAPPVPPPKPTTAAATAATTATAAAAATTTEAKVAPVPPRKLSQWPPKQQ